MLIAEYVIFDTGSMSK